MAEESIPRTCTQKWAQSTPWTCTQTYAELERVDLHAGMHRKQRVGSHAHRRARGERLPPKSLSLLPTWASVWTFASPINRYEGDNRRRRGLASLAPNTQLRILVHLVKEGGRGCEYRGGWCISDFRTCQAGVGHAPLASPPPPD
jgi:hypothetical protein